ncbi:MAG: DUF4157 domain-containing protein [Saprospiraceae bacterium]
MKTTETQKSTNSNSHSSKPFFNKGGEGTFFSQATEKVTPFFSPYPIQTKLAIGQPNDRYEKEADIMAEKVVQKLEKPNYSKPIQRKCENCGQEDKLQKMEEDSEEIEVKGKPIFETEGNSQIQTKSIENQLNSTKGGGRYLSENTRSNMEFAFGADFSSVKVHTDSKATQMSQKLGARAFTHGSNVYFNKGEYAPESTKGEKLLAHELTHVLQQKEGLIHNKIQRQSIHNPLFPCFETPLMPGGMGFFGTLVHLAIQQHYVSSIDPMAATEYTIPGSGLGGGNGRADIVSSIGGIYEIKPYGLATQGYTEAESYVLFASQVCDPNVNWHLGTIYYPPSTPMVIGNEVIVSWLIAPGVIAYFRRRLPEPVPVPVPVPAPAPQTTMDKIKDFAKRVIEQGLDAEQAAEEFLRENPGLVWTILGLGAVGIIILLADDLTLAGIADDVLIPVIATLMRVAWRFA